MKTAQAGRLLIQTYEGCKLKAYLCPAGKWTIGFGNTFYENGQPVKQGDQITQARAQELLSLILVDFENMVSQMVKSKVTQNQFDALVSFAYNCGLGNLQNSTLLKRVNANPNDLSIAGEFMKWNRANGKVLLGLTRRRKAEADLYFF